MHFSEYQKAARTTAIYPEQYRIAYPCLGLVGETGEAVEKLLEAQGSREATSSSLEDQEELKKEVGDILWYIANLAHDLEIAIDFDLAETGKPTDVSEECMSLMINVAKASEKVKKILRDDSGNIDESKAAEVRAFLENSLHSINNLCGLLGFEMNSVAEQNLTKIQSRQARGVLHGSGDNR